MCKSLVEKAIREGQFGQEPILHLLCGKVNLKLQYMIVAETMLVKASVDKKQKGEAFKLMALLYREQNKIEKSIEMY